MALRRWCIEDFMGIDQSSSENKLASGYSPDACNMDTENGDLAVGKGYVKHFDVPIPGEGRIHRMYQWYSKGADKFVVAAGNALYAHAAASGDAPAAWETIYTYPSTVESDTWDFMETRIGSTDCLVIANGQAQLVKWTGEGAATLFGSGLTVHETTIASVTHNANMALTATYDESLGVYAVAMPNGWTFEAGARLLFVCPADVGTAQTVRVRVGEHTFAFATLPNWQRGDTVVMTTTSATEASAVILPTARACAYVEATTGVYTLAMPTGWEHADNAEIAFYASAAVGTATTVKVKILTNTYTMAALPTWVEGELVVLKLTSATAAEAATLARANSCAYTPAVGTYALTMPDGWAYAQNAVVAFPVPAGTDMAKAARLKIADTEYELSTLPGWLIGDTAMVCLTGADSGVILEMKYGVDTVTLTDAIPTEWAARAAFVGVQLDGLTYLYSAISQDRRTLTLAEICTTELTAGMAASVRGGVSDAPVGFIEIHASRLFSAGDARYPARLYWSQPPGDQRSIEDWSMDDASDLTSGGYVEIGNTSSDPIVGLCSLSSQLLIFKRTSIYRLLGDRPSNYKVTQVNLSVEPMVNSGRILYGDVPFWLTRAGLYFHDGQQATPTGTARQVQYILDGADIARCKAAECRNRFYFTLRTGDGDYDDAMLVYDNTRRTYMLRNGFSIIDICASDGKLYMVNDARYIYRWGVGHTYDGEPINAYWKTPMSDFGRKDATKALKSMRLRGEGRILKVDSTIGKQTQYGLRYQIPADIGDVVKIPLRNEGCAMRFKIYNEKGSYFRLTGGAEIHYELKENT